MSFADKKENLEYAVGCKELDGMAPPGGAQEQGARNRDQLLREAIEKRVVALRKAHPAAWDRGGAAKRGARCVRPSAPTTALCHALDVLWQPAGCGAWRRRPRARVRRRAGVARRERAGGHTLPGPGLDAVAARGIYFRAVAPHSHSHWAL